MRYLIVLLVLLFAGVASAQSTETPNGTISVTNSNCTTANFHTTTDDDPDAPGGDWCTTTADNAAHDATVQFTNPSITLDNTSDAQQIALYVRHSQTGGDTPTVAIHIFDGVDCADPHDQTGTAQNITSDTGQLLTENWTSAGISSPADVCVQLVCTFAGGPPASRNSCEYDAIEWRAAEGAASTRNRLILVE